jgi:hypothetical protein
LGGPWGAPAIAFLPVQAAEKAKAGKVEVEFVQAARAEHRPEHVLCNMGLKPRELDAFARSLEAFATCFRWHPRHLRDPMWPDVTRVCLQHASDGIPAT